MFATVTLYKETGLGPGNSLDSIGLLSSFTSASFPDVAVKQNMMLKSIKIAATFDDVKTADYCKIGDMLYYITSIDMLNDNVAKLSLQPDFVTTVGINDLTFTSGWCKRRHYSEAEDQELFSNLFDEPFTPVNEPVIEVGKHPIKGNGDPDVDHKLVVSSINITSVTNEAKKYIETLEGLSVVVPMLPSSVGSGNNTEYESHCIDSSDTSHISMTNAFNLDSNYVKDGIDSMRSLGIESAISAAYVLPDIWADVQGSISVYKITDRYGTVSSNITPRFSVPDHPMLNNKVFSGQFNKVKVLSMCSGDEQEFRIEDVINHGGDRVFWLVYADCKYNGAPGCKPKYFKGKDNKDTLFGAVKGANWQQTPFMYNQSSGFGFVGARNNVEWQRRFNKGLANTASALFNLAGGMATKLTLSGAKDFWGDFGSVQKSFGKAVGNADFGTESKSLLDREFDNRQRNINTYERKIDGYGDLSFPENPYLADYIGNVFYDVRTRLSDKDMIRFDRFLSAYGYAVDEDLLDKTANDNPLDLFNTRTKHNYVQIEDVGLKKAGVPMFLLNGVAEQFETGIRIWHVAPNLTDLYFNPKV